jgi:hypothetical protein
MPQCEIRLVRGSIAVFVRVLELIERGVLGIEQASVSAEEVVVDCADGSGKGEQHFAPEVVRFGHGHLLRTYRARARALGNETVLHPSDRRYNFRSPFGQLLFTVV